MMLRRQLYTTTLIAACCFSFSFSSLLQASSPTLSKVLPRGAQKGAEVDVIIYGGRIADPRKVMFHRPGVECTHLEAVNGGQVKAKFKIAPEAEVGEYPFRLVTKTGFSDLRTFYVGLFPNVDEKEPNNDFEQPQAIPLEHTVEGVVQNEDVDYFVVEAKKGQRICAEVEGMRLGLSMFDPYVAILNEARFEISARDDTALALQDPVASIIAPEDGKYIIQVREASYGGNGNCHYRLHVGTFPRPSVAYPAGGKAGEEVEVQWLGDAAGAFAQKTALPADGREQMDVLPTQNGQQAPSPAPIRVSGFPNVLEVEPNNEFANATKAETPAPIALNGIIEQEKDVDVFRFTATKGQIFDIEVFARRIRSPLDPVLNVYAADGKGLAGNDDSRGQDSYLRFAAPADGEYLLRVTDHLQRGGPEFAYRVEFLEVKPSLTLSIPEVARNSQDRWAMAAPKGNRFATLIQANRVNFGGDLDFSIEGLPPGVTMHAVRMPASQTVFPLVFEAAADAPNESSWSKLNAKLVDPNQNIVGGLLQNVDLVLGPPNNTVYYRTQVQDLGVAVTDEAPFKISIVQPQVPLVQNGSMNLKIVAERKEGFAEPITCYFPYSPPGVGAASSARIDGDKTETLYSLNANSGAAVGDWPMVVIAQANVGDGPLWVSSQLATLKIAGPFVGMKIEMAATEQGKPVDVVCTLEQQTPFEGKAKVRLIGLPAKVATVEKEITKDDKEVVFPVTVGMESPAGQHKTLFCQIEVPQAGDTILHNVGHGAVLRIDPPPPPKKEEPMVAEAKPAEQPKPQPAAPPEKRLSRLEKLRLEQAQKSNSGAGGEE